MPPKLMLLSSVLLSVYLYYHNSRDGEEVSGFSWVFAVWFMFIGSRSLGDWLWPHAPSDIVTGTEGNPINVVFDLTFAAFGFYVISKRRISAVNTIRLNTPLFVLLAYCMVSCLWSDYPMVSFRRWARMALKVAIVIAILSEPDRLTGLKKLLERYAIFALPLSIVLIKYYPDMSVAWDSAGISKTWTGVALHKNSLGVGLAVCILYYVWKWIVLRSYNTVKSDMLLFGLASYILLNPDVKRSSTAILSLIPAVALLLIFGLYRTRVSRIKTVFYIVVFLVLLSVVGAEVLLNQGLVEFVVQLTGREMTFTGRTFIWKAVIEEAANRPIVGTGYGILWTGSRLERLNANYLVSGIMQAHNGYLEIYANLGVIGLVLLVITLLTALIRGLSGLKHQYEHNSLLIAYMVYYLLSEFFEASALGNSLRWIVLLILMVRMPQDAGYVKLAGSKDTYRKMEWSKSVRSKCAPLQ